KTTIIKILCNLISFNSGEILINGNQLNPQYVSYKRNWGIVLSKPYFIEQFDLVEYLYFVGKFHKIEKQLVKTRIDDLLLLLSLGDNAEKKIKDLSSGNQMKVSLAAALIHNPDFLILDEPFVNLDISTVERVMTILKSFRGKKTYVITSHNLEIIAELCDKILIMDKGKISAVLENDGFESTENLKRKIKGHLSKEEKEIKTAEWLN
ncbi:MAG: ABC transporter ATP-binding protein, partial [Cyclobacteriaceae bacterium]|nr:ABC transporter ATP-binding protein [Cyclobacteriaceae bacterium]